MAWVAADRIARSVRTHGLPGPALRWEQLRDQIHHDVLTHGFDTEHNTFTQAYGSAALDASLLLIPRLGFRNDVALLSDESDPRATRPAGARTALVVAARPRADRTTGVHRLGGTPLSIRQHQHRPLGFRTWRSS
jgi:Glycosyl hydrolases family 15